MDLYEILGIKRDATVHEIKHAYRKKAKTCHPDCDGGSAEEFEKVHRAYLILSDPQSREKYNATGDETLASPDNSQGEILKIIATALDQALQEVERYGKNPLNYDLASAMRIIIKKQISDIEEANSNMEKIARKSEKMLGRFKKKGEKVDFLEAMLRSKMDAINLKIQHNQVPLSQFRAAYAILEEVAFDIEPPDMPNVNDQILRYLQNPGL